MSVLPVGISGEAQYQISRSLRFNSADSAYLNRTFGTATSRTTWTWSGWVKRSALGVTQQIFASRPTTSPYALIYFFSNDTLQYDDNGSLQLLTTQVFRDASAWYHIVISVDTTQATSSNRAKIYVNGIQVTAFSTATYPAQNYQTQINSSTAHAIGKGGVVTNEYLSAYLTEVNFIDGQALTPSSFGETDPVTGVWKPKKYTGTYGTNGFFLNFSDASSAAALGTDYSGNGNTWTVNNLSVTAGAGNDSLVDVPTLWGSDSGLGGETRGNYATLNAVYGSQGTLSNGNLTYASTGDGTGLQARLGTIGVSSGKWYFEVTVTSSTSDSVIGIVNDSFNLLTTNSDGSANAWINKRVSGGTSTAQNGGTSNTIFTGDSNGDVVQIAFDVSASKFWIGRNGTWASSGDPAAGTNAQFTNLTSGSNFYPLVRGAGASGQTSTLNVNFGQRPFAYTAPSGFKALCTTNLPEPSIKQGDDYFYVDTYTGTGVARTRTIGFEPGLVWNKIRSQAYDHNLQDIIRGTGVRLISNSTDQDLSIANCVTAFNSDGYSVGNYVSINGNNESIVNWVWRGGGTGVTNTAGTITSTVSANTTSGFSIVTAAASGTSPVTVGHGLGVAPRLIIGKVRDVASTNWYVYSSSLAASDYLVLNSTAAKATSSNIWDVAPTSTVFTVGNPQNGWAGGNAGTKTYVFYAFAPVAGYSAFGSYTGNASTDGPFIYTGFRPRFIFGKDSGGTNNWWVFDSARDTYNVGGKILRPNLADAELDSPPRVDLLSNGFKIRSTNLPNDATTYIYAAFAENPFKYSLAR